MTRASELRALADRVEAAQGADRELDGEISRAIGTPGWRLSDAGRWFQSCLRRAQFAPTASLDAALTLVPAGWAFHVATESRRPIAWASCTDPRGNCPMAIRAATPALALTAAALRALAEEAGE
jgi:hypothetical protein